jgi:hypothetical protein
LVAADHHPSLAATNNHTRQPRIRFGAQIVLARKAQSEYKPHMVRRIQLKPMKALTHQKGNVIKSSA